MRSRAPVQIERRTRVFSMPASGGITATLTYYRSHTRQPMHYHPAHIVSFVLAGQVRERVARHGFELARPSMGFKPAGVEHSDEIGPAGALFLSMRISGDTPILQPGWSPVSVTAELISLVRQAILTTDPGDQAATLWDLVALEREPIESARGLPPIWLRRSREEMLDTPERCGIAECAAAAGVHRAHFSRLFHQYFGTSPSEFRRRCRVARALARTVEGSENIVSVAHATGFSDQSHLTRELRRTTGFPPAVLRRLLIQARCA